MICQQDGFNGFKKYIIKNLSSTTNNGGDQYQGIQLKISVLRGLVLISSFSNDKWIVIRKLLVN